MLLGDFGVERVGGGAGSQVLQRESWFLAFISRHVLA